MPQNNYIRQRLLQQGQVPSYMPKQTPQQNVQPPKQWDHYVRDYLLNKFGSMDNLMQYSGPFPESEGNFLDNLPDVRGALKDGVNKIRSSSPKTPESTPQPEAAAPASPQPGGSKGPGYSDAMRDRRRDELDALNTTRALIAAQGQGGPAQPKPGTQSAPPPPEPQPEVQPEVQPEASEPTDGQMKDPLAPGSGQAEVMQETVDPYSIDDQRLNDLNERFRKNQMLIGMGEAGATIGSALSNQQFDPAFYDKMRAGEFQKSAMAQDQMEKALRRRIMAAQASKSDNKTDMAREKFELEKKKFERDDRWRKEDREHDFTKMATEHGFEKALRLEEERLRKRKIDEVSTGLGGDDGLKAARKMLLEASDILPPTVLSYAFKDLGTMKDVLRINKRIDKIFDKAESQGVLTEEGLANYRSDIMEEITRYKDAGQRLRQSPAAFGQLQDAFRTLNTSIPQLREQTKNVIRNLYPKEYGEGLNLMPGPFKAEFERVLLNRGEDQSEDSYTVTNGRETFKVYGKDDLQNALDDDFVEVPQ